MPKLTIEQVFALNKKTNPIKPALISVEQFEDKSDRTLAFGLTGSEAHGRIEVMHVYFRDENLHVFSYFIGPDGRWLYSRKFSATVLEPHKLHIPNGVEWTSADSKFVTLMAKAGLPLWLTPIEVWGKRAKRIEDEYFGHVPELTCKGHPDSLNF